MSNCYEENRTHYYRDVQIDGNPIVEAIEELQEEVEQLYEDVVDLKTTKADKTYVDTKDAALESKINQSDYIYGIFMRQATQGAARDELNVFKSRDGLEFHAVKTLPWFGRDPSYIYKDGLHIIATTDNTADNRDFMIHYSTDMENWTEQSVFVNAPKIVGEYSPSRARGSVFAPELREIDGTLYYFISVEDQSTPVSLWRGGTTVNMHIYYGTWTVTNGVIAFSNCSKLNVTYHEAQATHGYIDADVIKYNGLVYMAIKHENEGQIQIYTAATVSSGFSYLKTLPTRAVEAPYFWIDNNSELWCYQDAGWDGNITPYCYIRSRVTNGLTECLKSDRGVMRHGSLARGNEKLNAKFKNVPITGHAVYGGVRASGGTTTEQGLFNIDSGRSAIAEEYGLYNYIPGQLFGIVLDNKTYKLKNCTNNDFNIVLTSYMTTDATVTISNFNDPPKETVLTASADKKGHCFKFVYPQQQLQDQTYWQLS